MAITPFLLECKFNSSLQTSYLRPLRSLFGLLFLYDHHQFAASGGMMGGSAFPSSHHHHHHSHNYNTFATPSYRSSSHATSCVAPVNEANEGKQGDSGGLINFLVITCLGFSLLFFVLSPVGSEDPQNSVVMLQVGSLNTGRSLQRDINRIAEVADASTSKGFNFVLQESILAQLRHSNYCISGYSLVDAMSSVVECEERFNQLTIKERAKFDDVTVDNGNNIRNKSATNHISNGPPDDQYIVVIIIVAADIVPQLPPIESRAQLKEALQNLASIPSSRIMGVHVLWTPRKEDDFLTKQRMREDYPLLHPL